MRAALLAAPLIVASSTSAKIWHTFNVLAVRGDTQVEACIKYKNSCKNVFANPMSNECFPKARIPGRTCEDGPLDYKLKREGDLKCANATCTALTMGGETDGIQNVLVDMGYWTEAP